MTPLSKSGVPGPDVSITRAIGRRASVVAALFPRLHRAIPALAFLFVYVALEWMSFIHEHKGVPVTPWNPGLGVAFAVLVLGGPAYGLVLFAGVCVAELFVLHTKVAWPVVIAIAAVVSVGYGAAAAAAGRYLRRDVGLASIRDVLVLLCAGVAGAAAVAVVLGLLMLATGELNLTDLPKSSVPLFVGDVIGIAVMAPLVLELSLRRERMSWASLRDVAGEAAIFVVVTGLALWMVVGSDRPNDYKYFSLLFLPVVAAAVRHGIDGSCLALAATQFGLVGLLHAYGYDAVTFTEFQIVMFVLTMTGLLVGVVVSERRRADREAHDAKARLSEMQEEASRAARANMVSGMASALAHEINQPMTAARALARSAQQILRQPDADLGRVEKNLSGLVVQIDHAGGVVRRMREFLRRGTPHLSTLDVRTLLDDALVLVRPDVQASGIRIDVAMEASLPAIFADRIQLQQVIINLVRNAADAIVESQVSEGLIQVRANRVPARDEIEIRVIDNGIGVPADRNLFEPLSSSKSEGLGLGLSISASIVQAHGGRLWLHASRPGETEFRFTVPVEVDLEGHA